MTDISPLIIFTTCGSSSIPELRSKVPSLGMGVLSDSLGAVQLDFGHGVTGGVSIFHHLKLKKQAHGLIIQITLMELLIKGTRLGLKLKSLIQVMMKSR